MGPDHSGGPSSSERSWFVRVSWTFEKPLHRLKKMDRFRQAGQGREGCWEAGSWFSFDVFSLLWDGAYSSNQFDIWLHATP